MSAPPGSRFRKGDRVAAMMPLLGSRWGAYAEYAAVREDFVAGIPEVMPTSYVPCTLDFPVDPLHRHTTRQQIAAYARDAPRCLLLQGLNDTDAASLPLVALTVVQAFDKLGYAADRMKGKKVLIHAGNLRELAHTCAGGSVCTCVRACL